MKTTGIIRRVDELGRIMLPKDVRRQMQIGEYTPLEIFVSDEGILLKKYSPEKPLADMVRQLRVSVEETSIDLGPEIAGEIQNHLREIQLILKSQN